MLRGFAPVARLTIRDEDSIVRDLDTSDDGSRALANDGLSELLRGTSAIFRTQPEGDIVVHEKLSPKLYQHPSPCFAKSPLCFESQRLRTLPSGGEKRKITSPSFFRPDYRAECRIARSHFEPRVTNADGQRRSGCRQELTGRGSLA